MSIEDDFGPQTATQMWAEFTRFPDKCHYDETRKKIIYHNDHDALEAYLALQREEIERHKWIESEKAHCDLGEQAMTEWIRKYSSKFACYWRQTHVYIPSNDVSPKPSPQTKSDSGSP